MSDFFYNPVDSRIYLTDGKPTILPLPVGLVVTINESNRESTIIYYKSETDTYVLDILGKDSLLPEQESTVPENLWFKASDFRLNPTRVKMKYNKADNTISFSPKDIRGGGKTRKNKTRNV